MLEKSSTSYLGSRCREFESPHSDQKPESALQVLAFSLFMACKFFSLPPMVAASKVTRWFVIDSGKNNSTLRN